MDVTVELLYVYQQIIQKMMYVYLQKFAIMGFYSYSIRRQKLFIRTSIQNELLQHKFYYYKMSCRSLTLSRRLCVALPSPKCAAPFPLGKLFLKLMTRCKASCSLRIWELRTNQGVPTAGRRTLFSNLPFISLAQSQYLQTRLPLLDPLLTS